MKTTTKRQLSILSLSMEGDKLSGAWLKRTNGSVKILKNFSATLNLDPLNAEPELAGQEIRNLLDKEGIKERRCVVSVPQSWALAVRTIVPDIPEADKASFLEIEAERGFSYPLENLCWGSTGFAAGGKHHALLVALPRNQVEQLEKVLLAAGLRPSSFTLDAVAAGGAARETTESAVTLTVGEENVGLALRYQNGLAALRTFEGVVESEAGQKRFYADVVAREIRITLGQMEPDIRESIRSVEVVGQNGAAGKLAEQLKPRCEALNIPVRSVAGYGSGAVGAALPKETPVRPELTVGAAWLLGLNPAIEFLPPRVSAWKRLQSKVVSQKLTTVGAVGAALVVLALGAWMVQQWQLSQLESRWAVMEPKAVELGKIQQQIKLYRPWFDSSSKSLRILRQLTMAFPESGAVSAKNIELDDLRTVSCSGAAEDHQAFIDMIDRLRETREVSDVMVDQLRGGSPIQFSFHFQWVEGGAR